jgi:hypothetical protein
MYWNLLANRRGPTEGTQPGRAQDFRANGEINAAHVLNTVGEDCETGASSARCGIEKAAKHTTNNDTAESIASQICPLAYLMSSVARFNVPDHEWYSPCPDLSLEGKATTLHTISDGPGVT